MLCDLHLLSFFCFLVGQHLGSLLVVHLNLNQSSGRTIMQVTIHLLPNHWVQQHLLVQQGVPYLEARQLGCLVQPQSSSPFSSTTTFGASSSPAFAISVPTFGASSTPSFGSSTSLFGGSSIFSQKPAFGFGSTSTQASPFGSTTQQSQPAFGSSLFGSSTPFGASSQSAFGATSTPAFGATSSPDFGATSTPAFGATSSSDFGATSTPPFGATSTPPFGASSTSAFGATSTPAFGATSSPAVGPTSTPPFGATSTPPFGASSTSAFGVTSTPAFGATSSPPFGATSTPPFGATSTPPFGATSTSPFGASSTSAFGATSTPALPYHRDCLWCIQYSSFWIWWSVCGFQHSSFWVIKPSTSGLREARVQHQHLEHWLWPSTFGFNVVEVRIAAFVVLRLRQRLAVLHSPAILDSISAMPVYKDKSHEEAKMGGLSVGR
ncbi:hypothetical protein CUMW_205680 [Citrus unshiu]|uniref:Uncharacterized protein n=1 Tax=Citrus unshiu TaxID=55188 RepID=A0A2H5Q8C3_CITUN|nr:hypothetical protein CUMW_205680 [Citrus unshiu]